MNMMYLAVLIAYLVICFIIGIYTSRKGAANGDMAIGGRSLGPFVLAATWAATQMSAATFIGGPGMAYSGGWASVLWGVACMIPFISLAWFLLPKKLRNISERVGAVTVPGLLLARYKSKKYTAFLSVLMLIAYVPVVTAQISSAGIVLQNILGIDYTIGILLFGGLVVIYTSAGGYLAVCYTDFVQAIFMVVGLVVAVPSVLSAAGGLGTVNANLAAIDPGMMSPFGVGGTWTWMLIISWLIYYGFQSLGQPYTIVRYLSAKDTKVFKTGFVTMIIFYTFCVGGCCLIGLAARTLISDLPLGQDYALVEVVKQTCSPIIGGVVVASIFAACMSTVDSALHVVGTAISRDLFKDFLKPDCTPKQERRVYILGTAVLGIASLIMAVEPPKSVMNLLTYGVATLVAMMFMPIVAGIFWKRFNLKAAFASSAVGGVLALFWFIVMGGTASGIHPAGVAIPAAIIVGIVVALLTKPQPEEELAPFFHEEDKLFSKSKK